MTAASSERTLHEAKTAAFRHGEDLPVDVLGRHAQVLRVRRGAEAELEVMALDVPQRSRLHPTHDVVEVEHHPRRREHIVVVFTDAQGVDAAVVPAHHLEVRVRPGRLLQPRRRMHHRFIIHGTTVAVVEAEGFGMLGGMGDGVLVDVGDVTLFVRELGERGDKPSLVVMHGGPDVGHGYLVPGFEPLARDHHVVLFDFRGCGRSSRGLPDEDLQPEYVIEDTHRLIDKLGLGQVDLLGFSTGGRAAMQFVGKHPEQVRRLVLASTTAYSGAEQYLAGWEEYQRRQRAEDAAGGRLRNSTVFVWDLDLAPTYLELLESLGSDTGDWSEERAINGTMHPWCPGDPERILRDSGKPILILHGEQDMGFPVQLARRLHAALPTSHLAVIPNAAHMCHFEKPLIWSNHIREFLQSPDPTADS